MAETTNRTPAEAAAAADFGKASARKAGRDPRWPYVPVLLVSVTGVHNKATEHQILGRAFATRDEAVADAERHIASLRADLERKLGLPNYRALRAQHGVTS